jgi:hypothetical protein
MTVDVSAALVWRTLRTDGVVASKWPPRLVRVDDWSRGQRFFSDTGTRSKMKSSVLALALAVAASTAALPEVAFRAIQISRRFALNHHRVLSPHTIVRRSSRDFAARRTTSTASAGASLASATATTSWGRSLFRTSIRSTRQAIAGVTPPCARVAMCASKDVSIKRGGPAKKIGIIAGDPRPHVLDSSVSFNDMCPPPRRLRL